MLIIEIETAVDKKAIVIACTALNRFISIDAWSIKKTSLNQLKEITH